MTFAAYKKNEFAVLHDDISLKISELLRENGAAEDKFAVLNKSQDMYTVSLDVHLSHHFEWNWGWKGGYIKNGENHTFVNKNEAKSVITSMTYEYMKSDAFKDFTKNYVSGSIFSLIRDSGKDVVLGQAPHVICYEDRCGTCNGYGNYKCSQCTWGKRGCMNCGRTGYRSYHGSDGRTHRNRCSGCHGSGDVLCYNCNGTAKEACNSCYRTGIVTHYAVTTLRGNLTLKRRVFNSVSSNELFESIPEARLIENSWVHVEESNSDCSESYAKWSVNSVALMQKFAVGEKTYHTTFWGKNLIAISTSGFMDDIIAEPINVLETLTPIHSFEWVARYSLMTDVRSIVLDADRSTSDIVEKSLKGLSIVNIERIMRHLQKSRDAITSDKLKQTWRILSIMAISICTILMLLDPLGHRIYNIYHVSQSKTTAAITQTVTLIFLTLGIYVIAAQISKRHLRQIIKVPVAEPARQGRYLVRSLVAMCLGWGIIVTLHINFSPENFIPNSTSIHIPMSGSDAANSRALRVGK